MPSKPLPSAVSDFLSSHGGAEAVRSGLDDPASLVRAFRNAAPSVDADPLSRDLRAYLTAVLDCIEVMDEQLYEHYRALIDVFRAGIFSAPREKLLTSRSWNSLCGKGVQMGLLPEDLYGKTIPHPHIGLPDEAPCRKEEIPE